jgi:glycosyltransferase involved in cell wall biosynthesis
MTVEVLQEAGTGPATICVNGKWLAQPASGTQRYATEVMRAVNDTPIASQVTLIMPRDAVQPSWATNFRIVQSRFRGQLFEQLALPWLSRGKHLYSLAGPAPLAKRDQTLVMHDAMPFRYPSTFRLIFVMWYHLMYGLLSRTAKRIMTVSLFSRAELAGVLRVPECRFQLAPCGADHVDADPLAAARPALPFAPGRYALIVGNLAPHKNGIAAATALSDAGVAVAIVGGTQHIFRDVKLEKRSNVCFLGRIDDHQLQRLYSEAAVLVAPSSYEGFGLPIVEAGRLGCPSVYATGSAMTEVAGDGGIGYPAEDLGKCAELVKQIIVNRELRDDLGARARANAERFSWERTAEAIFESQSPAATAHADPKQSPVRILHVTETFSAGTGSAIIGYAKAIQSQGIESHLLAQDRGSGLLEELGESSPFVTARIIPQGLTHLWRAVGSAIEETKPDIVHLHSSKAGGVGRLRLMLRHTPVIVYSPHCFAFERRDIPKPYRWAYRGVEFLLARRTATIVCVSPHEAELAKKLGSKAHVIHLLNSFPGQRDAPAGAVITSATTSATDTMRIVTVGRVAPQKDPDMFSQIVSMLRAGDDVEATWVGDGAGHARDELERSGVEVTGWLPAEQVPDAIAGHSAYLHTAGWEAALPISAIDAMAAGLPVVVRRNPAYRFMLPEDWQFDDAQTAVAMIRALTRQPTRLRRIREQFDLLAELRKDCPELVLTFEYQRLMQKSKQKSKPSAPSGTYYVEGPPSPTRHDTTAVKETRCGHHYSAS